MKKFIYMFSVLCMSICMLSLDVVSASDKSDTEEEVLRFIIANSSSSNVDQILYHAMDNIGYPITMDASTNAISKVNSGEYDGLAAATELSFNNENLIKVNEPIFEISMKAYDRTDSDIDIDNWNDLRGKNVATLYSESLKDNIISNTECNIVQYYNLNDIYDAISNGECDAAVILNPSFLNLVTPDYVKEATVLSVSDTYTYVHKSHSDIVPLLEESLKEIKSDGIYQSIINGENHGDAFEVLHISSYYPEDDWDDKIKNELLSKFSDYDDIAYCNVSLYSNRFSTDFDRAKNAYSSIRTMFLDHPPSAIVASDYNALNFVNEHYHILFHDIPVVYMNVAEDADVSPQMLEKSKGIYFEISADETLELALNIYPNTKQVFAINSYDSKGRAYKKQMETQFEKFQNRVNITYNESNSVDELKEEMQNLSDDTVVILGNFPVDPNNFYNSRHEIQKMITSSTDLPIFSMICSENGEIGGKTTDASLIASDAAKMVLDIYNGKDISDIHAPTDYRKYNTWTFNDKVISEQKINPKLLPSKYEHIDGKVSLRESNRQAYTAIVLSYILAILLILGSIIFVIREIRKNRLLIKVQKELHTSEELRKKEEETIAAQRILKDVMDATTYSIYWKNVETLTYEGINKSFAAFMNCTPEEIIGKTEDELFSKETADQIDIDDSIALSLNEPYHIIRHDYMGISRDVVFSVTKTVLRDDNGKPVRILGVLEDITENYTLEKQRQDTLNRLNMALEISEAGTWEMSVKDQTIIFDKGFADLFEIPYESPLNLKKWAEYLGSCIDVTEGKHILEYIENFDGSKNINIRDVAHKLPSGEVKYIYNSSDRKLDKNGNCISMLGMAWDNTDEIMLKKHLEEKTELAKQSSKAKSDFLSKMSHEIRTPLNAIMGMSKIASGTSDPNKTQHCLSIINSSSNHLLNIINDILDMSKIEAGKLVLNHSPFNLEKLLMNVCNLVIDKMEAKNQKFTVMFKSNMSVHYIGDELRLSQVFINLLSNAVKFTPQNGKITLSASEIEKTEKYSRISFEVEDSGIGMTEEQIARLFQSFEQADRSITSKYGGTGLGLSICKNLVEKMDGKIGVSSKLNYGSTFVFDVKLERQEADRRAILASGINPEDLKILVVDKDEEVRKYCVSIIDSFGMKTEEADCYKSAIGMVETASDIKNPYDIIFLDYDIENQDTLEMIRRLTSFIEKNTIIIMTSFSRWNEIENNVKSIGIDRYVPKPLFSSSVLDAINSVVLERLTDSSVKVPVDKKCYSFSDVQILFAEDSEINTEIFCTLLESTGIKIDVVDNGAKAVEKFKSNPDKYDMIIMDIQMPIMDGLEATNAIRALNSKRAKDVPIIAMTANVFKEDVDSYLAAGMNDHLSKPIDVDATMETISKYSKKS